MFPFRKTIETVVKIKPYRLIAGCALLSMATIVVTVAGLTWLSAQLIRIPIPYLGAAVHAIIGAIYTIAGWFMLPVLTVIIAGFFQVHVIRKVENEYYHGSSDNKERPFWTELKHDIRFTGLAAGLNILVLPFYLIGIGPFLSIILNSYLLGREFFEIAAGYHIGKPEARKLGQKNKIPVYLGGFIITCLNLVPPLNFFMPIIAVIWMIHVYHDVKGDI